MQKLPAILPFGNFVLDTLHTNTSLCYWCNACMLHINVILAFASPFAKISQEWVTVWLSHMQLDLDWQLKSPAHHLFYKKHTDPTFPLLKIQSYSKFKTQQNARMQPFWDASCNLRLQHLFSSARQDSQLFANSTCPNSHFAQIHISETRNFLFFTQSGVKDYNTGLQPAPLLQTPPCRDPKKRDSTFCS